MRRALPVAGFLLGLLAAAGAGAQPETTLGAFVGGAAVVAGDGVSSPGLVRGVAAQHRFSTGSALALELRVGFRSYESTEGGGPQYRDFDHEQVPVSLGLKVFLTPRARHPLFVSVGVVVAPGRTTVTQHFRPFPRPVPDEVTEESAVAFGGFAGVGVDLAVSARLAVVGDGRFEYQAGASDGDPDAGFVAGTVAVAYRF